MPTLLQAIAQVLRPRVAPPGTLRLTESEPGSTCRPITLHKSGQAVLLRPDLSAGAVCPRADCALTLAAQDRLFPLFRLDMPGLAVMCDYILFCQAASGDDTRLFVLHCELKSGNVDGSRRQIENGRLLVDYILAMTSHHLTPRPSPTVAHRGIVFSPKFGVPKGNLRKARCKYQQLPGGFGDMPFAYYACGEEYPLEHFCV